MTELNSLILSALTFREKLALRREINNRITFISLVVGVSSILIVVS